MFKHKFALCILLSLMLSITTGAFAAPGDISTIAGGGIKDNVPASESMVSGPWNMFIDGSDNIYIADWRGNYITKVDANGTFSVVVGNGLYKFDGDGLPPKEMSVRSPNSVAADSDGNVYFQFNSEMRKVDPSGTVSTVISGGYSGRLFIDSSNNIYYQSGRGIIKYNLQTATSQFIVRSESLGVPSELSMDASGNLYLANEWDFEVVKITPSGQVSKVAGNGDRGDDNGTFSGDGGPALQAGFSQIRDVVVDANGNLYISDNGNRRIRKVDATTGNVTTIAGNGTEGNSGDGGPATSAQIGSVSSIALDSNGNLYIADESHSVVRKVNVATGTISTIAGQGEDQDGDTDAANLKLFGAAIDIDGSDNLYISAISSQVVFKVDATTNVATIIAGTLFEAGFEGDGGPATSAKLHNPRRIHVDASGNIYLLDTTNQRVRKVDASTGVITTIAGNGEEGFNGDGPGTQASLQIPWGGGLATDASGNLYISDQGNNILRKVDAQTGHIQTIMGNETGWGYRRALDGRLAGGIEINSIQDLSVDPSGNVYIADQGDDKIWKVDATTGIITTLAGTGQGGFSGDGGPATSAQINNPRGVYADASGNVYIGDRSNHRIRKVDTAGIITTIAGGNAAGERGTLRGNATEGAPATDVLLGNPQGISMNSSGELHFTDRLNRRVYRMDSAGNLHTVAGTYVGDGGPATEASMSNPHSLFIGSDGSQYIADGTQLRVRKVDPSGIITTIAGNGSNIFSGDGGPATAAGFTSPTGIFVTPSNTVIITDNNRIRQVDTSGNITTIAGNPDAEIRGDGGAATQAQISARSPFVDGAGNLYFVNGSTVRKIDTNGIITTVAGNGTSGFSGDGGPALDAQLNGALNMVIDNAGNLFIADNGNRRIRKVDATTGIISTVAGNGERNSTGDGGPATDAALGDPWGVFVDGAGNIFISEHYERNGNRIRKVDATTGIISTVAGNGSTHYLGDGIAATDARLWTPSDVFVDSNGDLFIADQANQRIRKVEGAGAPTTLNPGVYQGPTSPELVATEAGSNVEVALSDLGANAPAISLTFDNVSSSGVTTVAPVESGPPPPEGLRLGEQTVYYDFNTTATFSGPVDLCFNYTGMNVGNEAELKLFHFVNDVWTDVTTSLDTQNNIICGQASSFSFFALFVPQPAAPTPKHLAVVQATVTQGGVPVVGATISFSHSVANQTNEYLYQATTDAEGNARVEIIVADILIRKGASGYYNARITDASGTVLDTYHSVPIAGQQEVAMTFPIGESLVIGSARQIDFGLSANVPNPFNPSTTIAYQIPKSSDVSLVIYNALGQHVRTLTNTFQSAGQYRVTWDGKNARGYDVSSGVYFYRLISNNNVQTRRMLLLK